MGWDVLEWKFIADYSIVFSSYYIWVYRLQPDFSCKRFFLPDAPYMSLLCGLYLHDSYQTDLNLGYSRVDFHRIHQPKYFLFFQTWDLSYKIFLKFMVNQTLLWLASQAAYLIGFAHLRIKIMNWSWHEFLFFDFFFSVLLFLQVFQIGHFS